MPSTVISYFSYHAATSVLTITFVSGEVYRYANVPKKIYRSLQIAGSKGRYFNKFIRNQFPFEHING